MNTAEDVLPNNVDIKIRYELLLDILIQRLLHSKS